MGGWVGGWVLGARVRLHTAAGAAGTAGIASDCWSACRSWCAGVAKRLVGSPAAAAATAAKPPPPVARAPSSAPPSCARITPQPTPLPPCVQLAAVAHPRGGGLDVQHQLQPGSGLRLHLAGGQRGARGGGRRGGRSHCLPERLLPAKGGRLALLLWLVGDRRGRMDWTTAAPLPGPVLPSSWLLPSLACAPPSRPALPPPAPPQQILSIKHTLCLPSCHLTRARLYRMYRLCRLYRLYRRSSTSKPSSSSSCPPPPRSAPGCRWGPRDL